MRLSQWIDLQKEHEREHPLTIKGRGLLAPTEELPITSVPIVEQDIVALFNQMLSSGLVRGIQLLSSSQYNQYDGLYRILMNPPFDKYKYNDTNPLGANPDQFVGVDEPIVSQVSILEYKYSVDALIEEFSTDVKNPEDIGLVVAWEMGERFAEMFDVLSYLDNDNLHHREFHGFTHSFSHAVSGTSAFQAIILQDLINYCLDGITESARQKRLYSLDMET
jgi:hypothetical protein